eukprot:5738591-Amphidinium_carterae.1
MMRMLLSHEYNVGQLQHVELFITVQSPQGIKMLCAAPVPRLCGVCRLSLKLGNLGRLCGLKSNPCLLIAARPLGMMTVQD